MTKIFQNFLMLVVFSYVCNFAPMVWAADDAGDSRCNPEGTQAEMNVCAYETFDKQDAELNRLYNQHMARLETPEVKKRFKKAQLAWIRFRDESCMYEIGPREESGSIWPLLNMDCLTAFTEERVKRLKYYVSCTDDQCPK